MAKKDYHKPGYWKDWYWNKGGKRRVALRRLELGPCKYGTAREVPRKISDV